MRWPREYLRFLGAGLILGLFTEIQLKLVAGIRPSTFLITLVAYPLIVTAAFAGSRLLDRWVRSRLVADVLHYLACGVGGLAIEWTLLGNGPSSNALQPGMFAMWTTFCFGPRILSRDCPQLAKARRSFWRAFTVVAIPLTAMVALNPSPEAKVVLAVIGLSLTYLVWSVWLLVLSWRSTRDRDD